MPAFFSAEDRAFMARALLLAERGLGRVSPNPPVGCVIVQHGAVVAEGYHQAYGGLHAEAEALAAAAREGRDLRGATAYVTLMPCGHQGRQPPCAPAVARAGVARVVAAVDDPHGPAAAGRRILEAAGVRVEVGLFAEEAAYLARGHFTYLATGRPYVTHKYAMTLDGKIAARTGDSRWVSGPEARALVHRWRAESDAVLVGAGTVLADDPTLTARPGDGGEASDASLPQPRRVVFDSQGRVTSARRVVAAPGGETLLFVCVPPQRLSAGGATVVQAPAGADGHVDAAWALAWLARERGVRTVLSECGGTLAWSLFATGMVDEVAAFVAPKVVGGIGAPSPVGGAGREAMATAFPLEQMRAEPVGDDWLLRARILPPE